MSSRIKHDDILLLEQPILKVPTDSLRSSLRSTQRILERDFDKLNNCLKEAAGNPTQSSDNGINPSDAQDNVLNAKEQPQRTVQVIDGLLLKARGLKRKLEDTYSNPQTGIAPSLTRIKARIDHLQDLYSAEYTTDHAYKKFSQIRLDRHLIDYMLRSGYTNSARSLSQLADIEMLTDAPLFSELAKIEKSLSHHSCSEALTWCKENSSALRKMQSTLEFELRYQEFIELAKAKKFNEAIAYSQKQLVPWQSTHLAEIGQVMTLLAFDQKTKCPPYARLYDENRWIDLLASFRSTLFVLLSIPEQPFLHLSLSVGLASLKLPACYANPPTPTTAMTAEDVEMSNLSSLFPSTEAPRSANSVTSGFLGPIETETQFPITSNYDPTLVNNNNININTKELEEIDHHRFSLRNPDCPVCDQAGLGQLAKECPWSHHVNSIIVCGLTGKVVNDGDGLAVLPNGRVYSRDGLEHLAYKDEGRIRCPRTGQVFGINEIRRVFIS